MSRTHKLVALAAALALILLGSLALWYLNRQAPADSGIEVTNIDGLPEGATVEVVDRVDADLFDNTPRPPLDRPLPQGSATAQVYSIMLDQRARAVAMIEESPASMTQWLGLGILHKQAGDYEGARIYFSYVATVNPNNLGAHWNLAQLYQYYLKDMARAEAEYRRVISLDPAFILAYSELYMLLMTQGKTDAAVAALAAGIDKNADDTDLKVTLARHYRDARDIPKAKEAYDAAIATAERIGNVTLVASLRTERAAL